MANKIPLVEMFGPTIQGEGSVIGTQTVFLRFGGCDYRCERCDSLHAVLPEVFSQDSKTQYLEMPKLIDQVLEFTGECEWVTFSGGNPCMWDLTELVDALIGAGKKISVETQGTIWQDWLLKCTAVTVSPKGPGMGAEFEPEKFHAFMWHQAEFRDQFFAAMDSLELSEFLGQNPIPANYEGYFSIKVVVFDQRDIEFLVDILQRWPTLRGHIFISIGNWQPPAPAVRQHTKEDTYEGFVMGVLESTRSIVDEVLKDTRLKGVRILPQLHTLIWGNGQGF